MAIAFVRNSGQVAKTSPIGGGAISLPITAGAVGNNLVVAVATAAATGATSCSDSSGTTYNLDAEVTSGVAITVMVFSAKITTAGVTSISINGFGASLIVEACAYEFSGLKSSTWFDTKGSGSGIGTSTSAGPTSGNITEGDTWIGAFGSTASLGTFTAGGSATGLTGSDQTGGSLGAEYLLTPTAGSTATATGTFSTTGTWAGLIVAYKAAPVAATVPLNAAGGSSGGSLAATAPTKIMLGAGEASSTGSLVAAAPTKIALNAGAGTSGGELFLDSHLDLGPGTGSSSASLAIRAPTTVSLSTAGLSGSSVAFSAPAQLVLRVAVAHSEAGGPTLEPSEELFAGEEIYPGLSDLPLTAPAVLGLAGASSSGGSISFTAPARIVLGAAVGLSESGGPGLEPEEGIEPGEEFEPGQGALPLTAPSLIQFAGSSASSSGSLGITAKASLVLQQASSTTEAGASQVEPSEELFPGEEIYPGSNVLFTAPSLLSLTANSTSGASLRATTTASLALNGANATSSASIALVVYQYLSLENGHGVSSSGLVLTRFVRGEADITVSIVYHAAVGAKVLYGAVPEIVLV